jgi:uracil-DNA glycosylase
MSWQTHLGPEKNKEYFVKLISFIEEERKKGKIIYPSNKNIFNAFSLTPLESVKVVILGQDPYHGPNQAHGLSFSVLTGIQPPPSLVNIYKEIKSDLALSIDTKNGFLEPWAKQGVLLLNSVLSVEAAKPASHAGLGWEKFTDKVIEIIDANCPHVVFMLWGSYAQKKGSNINRNKHLVLEAPHPSPLSAHRGFLGCKHFSKCNNWLRENNLEEINWSNC